MKPLAIADKVRCTALSTSNEGSTVGDTPGRNLAARLAWMGDVGKPNSKETITVLSGRLSSVDKVDLSVVEEPGIGACKHMKRALGTRSPKEAEGFEWHLKALYEYMQHIQKSVLVGEMDHQSSRFDWLNLSLEDEEQLLQHEEKSSLDRAVMFRRAGRLIEILRGTLEPLQTLMKDDLLYRFFVDGIGQQNSYALVAQYMDMLVHQNPDMSILEVGVGTGGTTLPVLQEPGGHEDSAPRFSSYTFTDISSGFFEQARDKLKPWAAVTESHKLNIEEEPSE
ncbi:MAG: hypothetical protein Q9170_002394 [Blastenia crenularia]